MTGCCWTCLLYLSAHGCSGCHLVFYDLKKCTRCLACLTSRWLLGTYSLIIAVVLPSAKVTVTGPSCVCFSVLALLFASACVLGMFYSCCCHLVGLDLVSVTGILICILVALGRAWICANCIRIGTWLSPTPFFGGSF